MGSVFNNLQTLKAHLTAMLILDIRSTNVLLHQLLPLLPFEYSLAARIQQTLVADLLQYL